MRKEDLRLSAGLTTNMIANMGKGEHISMKTLLCICEALNCDISDVIELGQNDANMGGLKMNKTQIVKHFYEVIVSSNLLEELYKYVSEDCVLISGDRKIPLGLEGMEEHLVAVKQTYPDYTMRILRQYEDGDYIISEFVMEGTHEGEWIGIKPTHKRLSFTGVDIDKVIDGKIVEHGGAVNTFETLYEQHMIKPV